MQWLLNEGPWSPNWWMCPNIGTSDTFSRIRLGLDVFHPNNYFSRQQAPKSIFCHYSHGCATGAVLQYVLQAARLQATFLGDSSFLSRTIRQIFWKCPKRNLKFVSHLTNDQESILLNLLHKVEEIDEMSMARKTSMWKFIENDVLGFDELVYSR